MKKRIVFFALVPTVLLLATVGNYAQTPGNSFDELWKAIKALSAQLNSLTIDALTAQPGQKIKGANIGGHEINASHIANGEVKGNHIGTGEIKGSHIANGEIKGNHIGNGEIKGNHIGSGEIKGNHIGSWL